MSLYELYRSRMTRAEQEVDYIACRSAYCDAIADHNKGEDIYDDDLDELCDLFVDICCRMGWPYGEEV